MPKKYTTSVTLVIVESPAKCKKIEEYLGPGYKCIATYGHLRELPSLKNIDIDNQFALTYTNIDNPIKKKQIEILRKEIKNAGEVIISSDSDREGELIAFSIIDLFKLPLNTKRITFNEITESALQYAIQNPKTIDMDLVNAAKARQILDILVGFKVSPILWKCISNNKANSLSAGRCQSPALRIIYDNQEEINKAEERKTYNITGYFTNSNLAFDLLQGKNEYETDDDVIDFLDGSSSFSHIYTCSQPKKIFKTQPDPFTTSTLQQCASNELHYAPKETMRICQQLYEGGYITYMRTDSKKYSKDFIQSTKEYIIDTYADGEKYINEEIDLLCCALEKDNIQEKEKDKLIQEAHEAIRPTNLSLYELPETVDSKERRMYKLIWENTLESCMCKASFNSITASISAFQNTKFTYTSEQVLFPGWKIVSKKYANDIKLDNKEYQYLQSIKKDSIIPYKKIYAKVTIKGSKQHYTEARLVQLLEEKGIGRPSTFSSLIDKIQERGYVKKENIKGKEIICKDYELSNGDISEIEIKREFGNEHNKLVIQPLGIIVSEFLDSYFTKLFQYDYTREMEDKLDKISKGEINWVELCDTCNKQIDMLVDEVKDVTKMEIKIDDNHTYIVGKHGPVIKYVEEHDGKEEIKFKSIKKDVDIHKIENHEYDIEDIVDTTKNVKSSYILGQHNGHDVFLKKGKFGMYISWDNNTKNLKELGNRPMENITMEEVRKYLDEGSNIVREINKDITIRKGPKGDYIFYKTGRMKKPQFFDISKFTSDMKENYKICDINILKSWIKDKHNI